MLGLNFRRVDPPLWEETLDRLWKTQAGGVDPIRLLDHYFLYILDIDVLVAVARQGPNHVAEGFQFGSYVQQIEFLVAGWLGSLGRATRSVCLVQRRGQSLQLL